MQNARKDDLSIAITCSGLNEAVKYLTEKILAILVKTLFLKFCSST